MYFPHIQQAPHYLPHNILPARSLTEVHEPDFPCTPAQWLLLRGGAIELSPGPLDSHELRTATLATTGMNNVEIAHVLPVTDSNVDTTLTKVFEKLDIESRRELVRECFRQEIYHTDEPIPAPKFTRHQAAILSLISEGFTYAEIAKKFHCELSDIHGETRQIRKIANSPTMVGAILIGHMSGVTDKFPSHRRHVYSSGMRWSNTISGVSREVDDAETESPPSQEVNDNLLEWGGGKIEFNLDGLLSPAESVVYRHLVQGYTQKEIANKLHKHPKTVSNQIESIFSKLNAKNNTHAVQRGIILGGVRVVEYGERIMMSDEDTQVVIARSEGLEEWEIATLMGYEDRKEIANASSRIRRKTLTPNMPATLLKCYISGNIGIKASSTGISLVLLPASHQ